MRFMASSSARQGKRRRLDAAEGDPHIRVWSPTPMTTLRQSKGCVLFWDFFSAYLCVPLRLCGKCARTTCLPQRRRGTQRYAEKIRHYPPLTCIVLLQTDRKLSKELIVYGHLHCY